MSGWSAGLVLLCHLAAAPEEARPADAPMRLLTAHGVELTADQQIFALFAALNVAGYSDESRRGGPPLHAPMFHPIRLEVRKALESRPVRTPLRRLRGVFNANPDTIETYVEAALSLARAGLRPSARAARLASQLAALDAFRSEVSDVYAEVLGAQREHMAAMHSALETDVEALRTVLADPEFRAPRSLSVVPTPLESHGVVRSVRVRDHSFLVVGPGLKTARSAILAEILRPGVAPLVSKAYPQSRGFSRSWATLRTSQRIAERWTSGAEYLTDALTRALAHRAITRVDRVERRSADEAFVDREAVRGMRWARSALRIVDAPRDRRPLSADLVRLLTQATP